MAANPNLDRTQRRVMFAMEFRDPVTRLPVTDGLQVAAEGLGAAGPCALRPVRLVRSRSAGAAPDQGDRHLHEQSYLPYDEVITTPEHVVGIPASSLRMPRVLRPTGLYEPPEGLTGAAGWLVEDEAMAPVADAELAIAFRHAGNQDFVSTYQAAADAAGGFVAIANDLGDIRPDPAPPGADANILGWLVVTRPSLPPRFTGFLPLRAGRLARLAAPLLWKDLATLSPP